MPVKENRIYEQSKTWLQIPPSVDQIDELRDVLRHHEWRYYIKSDPIISDVEYDQLFNYLKGIEQNNPELVTPDSPS